MSAIVSVTRPGHYGADYAYAQSGGRAFVQRLRTAGVVYVSRYYSWLPNSKVLTPQEADLLTEFGIGWDGNWEVTTGDMLKSQSVVEMAAVEACKQARACGQALGTPISWSHDTTPSASDRPVVVRNAKAWRNVMLGEGYDDGGYGGRELIRWMDEEGLIRNLRWQASGWSVVFGRSEQEAYARAAQLYPGYIYAPAHNYENGCTVIHPTAHALQWYGRVNVSLGVVPDAIDENVALAPFKVSGPIQGGSVMAAQTRYIRSDGAQFLLGPNGDDKVHVSPAYADLLAADGSVLIGNHPAANVQLPNADQLLAALLDGGSVRDVAGTVVGQLSANAAGNADRVISSVNATTTASESHVRQAVLEGEARLSKQIGEGGGSGPAPVFVIKAVPQGQ